MNRIQEAILSTMRTTATTHNGWHRTNCPMCIKRGHPRGDTKSRCGVLPDVLGSVRVHCFNCGFAAGWNPGEPLTKRIRTFLAALGATQTLINELMLESLRLAQEHSNAELETIDSELPAFRACPLPNGSRLVTDLIGDKTHHPGFKKCVEYLYNRHERMFDWYDKFYWTPEYPFRAIVPLEFNGVNYGWSGRNTAKSGKKYLNSINTRFFFNADKVNNHERDFVLVCEGIFDAIALDCISCLGSELSELQVNWLNACGKQVIVLPDRDLSGTTLINTAIDNGWAVSMPPFDDGIKDGFDAVKKYGRLSTLKLVLDNIESYNLKIQIKKKVWNEF